MAGKRMIHRRREYIDAQHHPRSATGRRIVNGLVPADSEVADLDGIQRPFALFERPPGQRDTERPGKHLRIERKDGS